MLIKSHGSVSYVALKNMILLLCFFVFLSPPVVSAQTLEASYPFLTDLVDATGNYGNTVLTGDPAPTPPAPGVPLCHNGIYALADGGQDIQIPTISGLDSSDFQINIEFNLTDLPFTRDPIIIGGYLGRWIGLYVDSEGFMGAKYNNSYYTWSGSKVSPGSWNAAQIRFESGELQIALNGSLIHQETVGDLVTGGNLDFTTNDYSSGRALDGCIRNLELINDTTLLVAVEQPVPTSSLWGYGALITLLLCFGGFAISRKLT